MNSKAQSKGADAILASVACVGVLHGVLILEAVGWLPVYRLGIVPRTEAGLVGILFAPLLHLNFQHLLANSIPLLVLLALLFGNPAYAPVKTLAQIWLVSGVGTWLIGRGHSVHIGASSIVFGLAAFLITAGFRLATWRTLLAAVLVFFFYGGIIYGVLPQRGPISWEGHLCGAVAGAWAAWGLGDKRR